MDNLGRALYQGAFALLFIFAASISIYLYGTLFNYLDEATLSTNIVNRAESTTGTDDYSNFKRPITKAEIYITLYNMEQMHVTELTVGGETINQDDVTNKSSDYNKVINYLKKVDNNKLFNYKSSGTSVTYE